MKKGEKVDETISRFDKVGVNKSDSRKNIYRRVNFRRANVRLYSHVYHHCGMADFSR